MKFNGETPHEITSENSMRRYSLQKLPPYLILQIKRFNRNNFFTEKNPTIVNFPLKNLDLKDYLHPEWVNRNPETHYDLVANICHEGKPADGTWRAHVYYPPTQQWFETQDLRVEQIMPQQVAQSESYLMIYKRQDVQVDGTFGKLAEKVVDEDMDDMFADAGPAIDVQNKEYFCRKMFLMKSFDNCMIFLDVKNG